MAKTITITLELTAEEDGDAAVLWADMKADVAKDPEHRLILETKNWFANMRVV